VVLSRVVVTALPLVGCQGSPAPAPMPRTVIEVVDASQAVIARVVPGHPCRATVDGVEMLVGAAPLVAQVGADRWTGEAAEHGTTLAKNGRVVARLHAGQLFDPDGIPIIRVLETGEIADKANTVLRTAKPGTNSVQIGDVTVTGTSDITLAAMLTARETVPEVRALAACQSLFTKQP